MLEKQRSSKLDPHFVWCLIFLAGLAGFVTLFFFNPAQHGFYPTCWFHRFTGLDCPGCGSLRALHQLLHGNIKAAFALNPLLVSVLPLMVLILADQVCFSVTGKKILRMSLPKNWPWLLLAILLLFMIVRNVPAFL